MLSGDGNLLKVDPATNEIAAKVSVGDPPSHLAVYGGGVWALVQAKEYRLVRVDPQHDAHNRLRRYRAHTQDR